MTFNPCSALLGNGPQWSPNSSEYHFLTAKGMNLKKIMAVHPLSIEIMFQDPRWRSETMDGSELCMY